MFKIWSAGYSDKFVKSLSVLMAVLFISQGYAAPVSDEAILKKIVPSQVFAEIVNDTEVYSENDLYNAVDFWKKGTRVEVLEDMFYQVYKVRNLKSDVTGYVTSDKLAAYEDTNRKIEPMSKEEAERAVSLVKLYSGSAYVLWCDIARQSLYVFLYENQKWNLIRNIRCATGKSISPTKRGFFNIYEKERWFYSPEYDSGALNALKFSGPYYIHSIPVDWDGNILDSTLGEKVSAGCIRVSVQDSEWLYDYIPVGTNIWVH